ncbi:hypothetical protein [Myceligenerans xiligouense]|uniref:hypothetical protein n=1 Tax=Myceligenerans xiligouense TaxID=253184 RepID=UPI000F50A4BC|nr:hypothetical protein [Myceligenerans xiligouense]
MSTGRNELHDLVDELSDEQLPGALSDLRRHLSVVRGSSWPPAWFGSAESPAGMNDASERIDEFLAEGFGRR